MRLKTDGNDARGIAQLVRLGWFKAVHVKAPSAQETRTLLNGRQFLVDKLTGIESTMRASLRNFGLEMGKSPVQSGPREHASWRPAFPPLSS